MINDRVRKLANTLLKHSVKLQPGERILIRGHLVAKPLLAELIDQAYSIGGYPYFQIYDDELERHLALGYKTEQLETSANWDLIRYKDIDAIITIIGEDNAAELSDIPAEKHKIYGDAYSLAMQYFINNKKWILLRYPTKALAQKANMSTKQFQEFLLSVCSVDYSKMESAMVPLVKLMNKTDKVRIVSPGTDLSFSIKGIPAIPCAGVKNLPDGEIYTAPIRDSVNGTISFNTPSTFNGTTFNKVVLTFLEGKIVNVESDNLEKLLKIFQTDEGASYIGEFALGVNPLILHPMNDILFDEKIAGSIHLTPGQAYDNADNGNRSSIHWDMVLIQRPEFGGGEIYFDDVLIRKDGRFVIPSLEGLNQLEAFYREPVNQ